MPTDSALIPHRPQSEEIDVCKQNRKECKQNVLHCHSHNSRDPLILCMFMCFVFSSNHSVLGMFLSVFSCSTAFARSEHSSYTDLPVRTITVITLIVTPLSLSLEQIKHNNSVSTIPFRALHRGYCPTPLTC